MHAQFEDLMSKAEAEAVIDRCRNFGKFERSQAGDQTPCYPSHRAAHHTPDRVTHHIPDRVTPHP